VILGADVTAASVTVSNTGVVFATGGSPTLTIANGTLSGNAEIGSGITLQFIGENDGSLNLDPGAQLEVNGGTLVNNNYIIWNGGASINVSDGGSLINNQYMAEYGGLVNVDSNSTFVNAGQIHVIGGGVDQSFLSAITNDGNIFLGGGLDLSGLTLANGTYTIYGDSPASCSAPFTITDADLVVQSELDVNNGEIDIDSGGILDDQGTLTINSDPDNRFGTINVNSGGTLDVEGTLINSSSTLSVNDGGQFSTSANSQLNFSDDSTYTASNDSVEGIYGTVAIDGQNIYDPVFAGNTVPEETDYTLYLGNYTPPGDLPNYPGFYSVASWSVNWGDNSQPQTSPTLIQRHFIRPPTFIRWGWTRPRCKSVQRLRRMVTSLRWCSICPPRPSA
jgi:hypothetical protein